MKLTLTCHFTCGVVEEAHLKCGVLEEALMRPFELTPREGAEAEDLPRLMPELPPREKAEAENAAGPLPGSLRSCVFNSRLKSGGAC